MGIEVKATVEVDLSDLAVDMDYTDMITLAGEITLDADDIRRIADAAEVDLCDVVGDDDSDPLAMIYDNPDHYASVACQGGVETFLEAYIREEKDRAEEILSTLVSKYFPEIWDGTVCKEDLQDEYDRAERWAYQIAHRMVIEAEEAKRANISAILQGYFKEAA